jgi:hypothetical protein
MQSQGTTNLHFAELHRWLERQFQLAHDVHLDRRAMTRAPAVGVCVRVRRRLGELYRLHPGPVRAPPALARAIVEYRDEAIGVPAGDNSAPHESIAWIRSYSLPMMAVLKMKSLTKARDGTKMAYGGTTSVACCCCMTM